MLKNDFWETKAMREWTPEEWEALCDGCARCCLHKLEDDETHEIFYTSIVCQYLDHDACRCRHYAQRNTLVPQCIHLNISNLSLLTWLPNTCAYRLIAEGKDLDWWHPLVSGTKETVHESGISIQGKVTCELEVDDEDWEDYIISS
ncbi:YcgN family cysteine cluster protein [Deltaproteobacteria bacterium TL4]